MNLLQKQCPIISCIIPVRDSEATLVRAVNSALNSGVRGVEVIVVDDGSNDRSLENLLSKTPSEKRLRTIKTPPIGPGPARNLGIEYSRGKYITFLDSDDYLYPNALRKLLMAAERKHLDIVSYRVPDRYFEHDFTSMPTLPTKAQFFRRELVEKHKIRQANVMSGQDGLFGNLLLSVASSLGHHKGAIYQMTDDRPVRLYASHWKNVDLIPNLVVSHMSYLIEEYDRLSLWEQNSVRLSNFLVFETLQNRLMPISKFLSENHDESLKVGESMAMVTNKIRRFLSSSSLRAFETGIAKYVQDLRAAPSNIENYSEIETKQMYL